MATVLFVATKTTPGVVNLGSALQQFGYAFRQVGLQQQWTGWRFRMQLYGDMCQTFDDDQLLVLSDVDDVLPVQGPEGLHAQFKAFGKNVVVSAEQACGSNCTPIEAYWQLHPDIDTRRRYVCCGLMIGYAKALRELWAAMLASGVEDDQVALGQQIQARPLDFAVDYDNKLFYTVSPGRPPDVRFDNEHRFDRLVDSGQVYRPYFIHYAGNFIWPQVTRSLWGVGGVGAYDTVARHVVGDSAMAYYQGSSAGQLIATILSSMVFGVLVIVLLIGVCRSRAG
jgi:hypothetical protein